MKYYCYRHIRLDKNEPFYIGIGGKRQYYNNHIAEYSRAYSKKNRSKWWRRVTQKTDYEVEILFESDDWDTIKIKEIEFIALHGRNDLDKGTLVNLTDGGEGSANLSKEVVKAISKGLKEYYKYNTNANKGKYFRNSPDTEFKNKPIYQIDKNFSIIKEFSGAVEASQEFGCTVATITHAVRGRINSSQGYHWCYVDDYSNKVKELKQYRFKNSEPSIVVYKEGNCLGIFKDRFEAAKILNIHSNPILKCLDGKMHQTKGYSFEYAENKMKDNYEDFS